LPPEPSPKPTPASPAPTPPPSPSTPPPEPSPAETPEPETGSLELDAYYYLFGDPRNPWIIFTIDGVALNADGVQAQYVQTGGLISLSIDGEQYSEMSIVDDYSIEEPSTGMYYIREGGPGFGNIAEVPAGPREFFTGHNYYLDGDAEGKHISFHDLQIAILIDEEKRDYGKYLINDSEITVTVDDEVVYIFEILDPATLKDALSGEIYGLEGLYDTELLQGIYYYQFGDLLEIYLCFQNLVEFEIDPDLPGAEDITLEFTGEVFFGFAGVEMVSGTVGVHGQRLVLEIDEEVTVLDIINSYTLRLVDQDILFIRMPQS